MTLRPTPLEVATGMVVGEVACDPLPETTLAPREALEAAMLPALQRQPCLVSFSGGRDSSAVLAVATHVARREGLPPPVPYSHRFPDDPISHESEWQELVVRHLGLDDWIRAEWRDELDLLGPVATGVLQRHGLLWPTNTYFHRPMLEAAAPGSLLTGVDGDGLLGEWRHAYVAQVLARRIRPKLRDALRVAHVRAPDPVRTMVMRRRAPSAAPWVRPRGARVFRGDWTAERVSEPLWWAERVGWYARRRYHAMGRSALGLLAADAGTLLVHPLLDPVFLAAVARHSPRSGYASRTAGMRILFSDVLPDEVLRRTGKAFFTSSIFGEPSRAFVRTWSGGGVDEGLVDPDALRAAWSADVPDPRAAVLLHAAWLASSRA